MSSLSRSGSANRLGLLRAKSMNSAVTLSMWRRMAATASFVSPLAMASTISLCSAWRDLQAAAVEDQEAATGEIGAGAVDDGADARELHGLEQDFVKAHVEVVEELVVFLLGGERPARQNLLEFLENALRAVGHEDPDRLALERLADEHELDHVGELDARHHRARAAA